MNKLLAICLFAGLLITGCDSSGLESADRSPASGAGVTQGSGINPLNANPPEKLEIAGKYDGSVISNGTIRLGVNREGNLNVQAGGYPWGGVGMQFLAAGGAVYESTFQGCTCEGWGVADATAGISGSANDAFGYDNVTVESFTTDGISATSVVLVGSTFRVTHVYTPSSSTANMYEVAVRIENISGALIDDLRYTRVMDWDIDPTPFNEVVTVQGTAAAAAILLAGDNGFNSADPLSWRSSSVYGDFVDNGPTDHGAFFDFGFGALGAGETFAFTTFYGGAGSEVDALAAVGAVKAEVYSFGQSSGGQATGSPATFIFGFKGVGGEVQVPSNEPPTADAGADQGVAAGQAVTLDGSASSDPDGDTLTYEWKDAGNNVVSTDASLSVGPFNTGSYTYTLTIGDGEFTDTDDVTITVSPISVLFDVKPEDTNNRINSLNKGVIPTAILGSASFDVSTVDVASLAFGPGAVGEAHGKGHTEDVNGDGFPDLVLHFDTQASGLAKGDTQACVTGTTTSGWDFAGCVAVDVFK